MNQDWIRLFIGLTFMFLLTIVPVPWFLTALRPSWVLLFLLYVQFYRSDCFNLFFVLIVGLLLDSILSAVMGEHIFALILTLWSAYPRMRRFALLSTGIQIFYISIFSIIYCISLLLINRALNNFVPLNTIFLTTLANISIWPIFRRIAGEFYFSQRPKQDWMTF